MKSKSIVQLILFVLIITLFGHVAWDSITKEAAFFGAIGGLIMHWALTNKGNKNVIYFKPFTAGWRVLIYDMLLLIWLITLYQQAESFNAFLKSLAALNEKAALLAAILTGIVTDYAVGG